MRDRWMNVGYEEDELKPYIEPQPDYKDPRRTGGEKKTKKYIIINISNPLVIFFFLHTHANTP